MPNSERLLSLLRVLSSKSEQGLIEQVTTAKKTAEENARKILIILDVQNSTEKVTATLVLCPASYPQKPGNKSIPHGIAAPAQNGQTIAFHAHPAGIPMSATPTRQKKNLRFRRALSPVPHHHRGTLISAQNIKTTAQKTEGTPPTPLSPPWSPRKLRTTVPLTHRAATLNPATPAAKDNTPQSPSNTVTPSATEPHRRSQRGEPLITSLRALPTQTRRQCP